MKHAFLFIVFTRCEAVLKNLSEIEKKCPNADIVIYFDAPYNPNTYWQWRTATTIIENYLKSSTNINAEIIYSSINLKGKRSVPMAITQAAKKYDFVTIIEDDVIIDVGFVNLALNDKMLRDKLERDYAALCLCPLFERPETTLSFIEADIFSSWGWIMSTKYWRQKVHWYEFNNESLKAQNSILVRHAALNRRFERIIHQINECKLRSWDAIFFYEMHLNNRKCLFTSKNLAIAQNVTEGTAQHNKKVRYVNKIKLADYSDINFLEIYKLDLTEYDFIWKKNYKGRIQWVYDLVFTIFQKIRN